MNLDIVVENAGEECDLNQSIKKEVSVESTSPLKIDYGTAVFRNPQEHHQSLTHSQSSQQNLMLPDIHMNRRNNAASVKSFT